MTAPYAAAAAPPRLTLRNAVACVACETVRLAGEPACPACASPHFWPVAAWLTRRAHTFNGFVPSGAGQTYVACKGCQRLLDADQLLNTPCEGKTDG